MKSQMEVNNLKAAVTRLLLGAVLWGALLLVFPASSASREPLQAHVIGEPFVTMKLSYGGKAYEGKKYVHILHPIVSPDGAWVVYEKNDKAVASSLYLLRLGADPYESFPMDRIKASFLEEPGAKERLITKNAGQDRPLEGIPQGFSFSPRSDRLAYGTVLNGAYAIRVYDATTGTVETITPCDSTPRFFPAWSPFLHRDRIAYISKRGGRRRLILLERHSPEWKEIFVSNAPDADDLAAKWSPDGKSLVVTAEDRGTGVRFLSILQPGSGVRTPLRGSEGAVSAVWIDNETVSFFRNRGVYVFSVQEKKIRKIAEAIIPTSSGPCWRSTHELFCIHDGVFKGHMNPLVQVGKDGTKALVRLALPGKPKEPRPLTMCESVVWNRREGFFAAVGALHKSDSYLYILHE